MKGSNHHDHTIPTHAAGCSKCEYIAQTHAHDDKEAAMNLSEDLAKHNREVHAEDQNPSDIMEDVK